MFFNPSVIFKLKKKYFVYNYFYNLCSIIKEDWHYYKTWFYFVDFYLIYQIFFSIRNFKLVFDISEIKVKWVTQGFIQGEPKKTWKTNLLRPFFNNFVSECSLNLHWWFSLLIFYLYQDILQLWEKVTKYLIFTIFYTIFDFSAFSSNV